MVIVRTRAEIERQLQRQLVPRTDNRDALVALGFTPAYPHRGDDPHDGSLWTRAIDLRDDGRAGRKSKTLVVERAVHVRTVRRRYRLRAGVGGFVARHRRYRSIDVRRVVRLDVVRAAPV